MVPALCGPILALSSHHVPLDRDKDMQQGQQLLSASFLPHSLALPVLLLPAEWRVEYDGSTMRGYAMR